jgi:uncharacterized protein (DUF885 family)
MSEFRSEIFEYADVVVERYAALDPLFATEAGVAGYEEFLPDFSPEGTAAQLAAVTEMCDHISTLSASDDIDRISLSVMRERLETSRGLLESGESERLFSVIHSPLSGVRQTFELMATDTEADFDVIATRLEAVGPSLVSWRRRLEELARTDRLASRRHVVGVADQAATYATGTFARFVERVSPDSSSDDRLSRAAKAADAACGELATWMREELVPQANERDYCGVERYRVWAKDYMGAELDFDEL